MPRQIADDQLAVPAPFLNGPRADIENRSGMTAVVDALQREALVLEQ